MEHFEAVRQAIALVRTCRNQINEITDLPELFKLRSLRPLTVIGNSMANIIGDPIEEEVDGRIIEQDPNVGKPLTHILGKPLNASQSAGVKPEFGEDEINQWRNRIDMLVTTIDTTPMKQFYDELNDDELRSVAKRVGLEVTETYPEKVDLEWVRKIYEKRKENLEFEAKKAEVEAEEKPFPLNLDDIQPEAERKDGAIETPSKITEAPGVNALVGKDKGKPGRKPNPPKEN